MGVSVHAAAIVGAAQLAFAHLGIIRRCEKSHVDASYGNTSSHSMNLSGMGFPMTTPTRMDYDGVRTLFYP